MYKVKSILKAIHAFIVINKLEDSEVEYIARLAEAAKICEDEYTWMLFSNMFDNDAICQTYLRFEASLD